MNEPFGLVVMGSPGGQRQEPRRRRTAVASQLPLLILMIGYTLGGLLLLFGG